MLGIAKHRHPLHTMAALVLLAGFILSSAFLTPPGHAQPGSTPAIVAYCGDVLVASSTTLSQNVMTVNGGNCVTNGLIVGANNILLNCAGHSITGQSPYVGSPIGIDLNGYTGVTIENCNVNLFVYGIAANPSNNDTFAGNTVDNNGGGGGFYFGGSSYNDTFIENTANNNTGAGFYFGGSSYNETFTGNTANNDLFWGFYFVNNSTNSGFSGNTADNTLGRAGTGFYFGSSSYNDTFYRSTASNNTGFGFYFGGSSYNETFTSNTANNNMDAGFYFGSASSSYNDTFTGNAANSDGTGAGGYGGGFYFAGSSNNETFTSNTANNNAGPGFRLGSSNTLIANTADYDGGFDLLGSSNTLTGNTANYGGGFAFGASSNTLNENIANNDIRGFTFEGSSNNTLTMNTANNNTEWGFLIENSFNNTLNQNTANSNAIYGYYIDTSSTLVASNNSFTGNTADNNTYTGFYIYNSSHNTFTGNSADNTLTSGPTGAGSGFVLLSSPNNTLSGNSADNNSVAGFFLYYSPNSTFIQNTANNNTAYGFYITGSSNLGSYNILTGNTANYNQYGFYDSTGGSGTSGTGNTYMTNACFGDTVEGSIPTGLCSATLTDFTITASPTTIYVNAGSASTSTIVIAAVNGFSGIVSLAVDNTACNVSPTSLTGSGSVMLTCIFASAKIPTVTVTGVSGSLSHTAIVTYNVASTTSGGCGTGCTVTVSSDATVTNFTSDPTQIGLTASGQTGTTAFANVTIPQSVVPNVSLLQVTINGTLVTPTITSDSTNYYVYFTFTFHSIFMIHVVFVPQDFTISTTPTILTVNAGTPAISTITVAPVDGFVGTVMLTASFSPGSGLACSVSATVVTGGSGNSTLTCSGTAGIYTVTVTGTSGTLSHTATIAVDIIDFTLTASPASITMVQGSSGTSYVTVASEGGSAGMVTLTVNSPTGLTAGLNPSLISMSGTSALTVGSLFPTTVPGTYFLNVTGTSGSLTHSVLISVTITSATANVPPPFLTQSTWDHRFSLSKYNNVQTFKFGVKSNSTNTTIYFSVTIMGVDGNGASGFTLTSGVSTLAPNKNLAGLTLSQTFSPSQVGETFNFQVTIHWGTMATSDPSQLPYASVATNGAPTSGSFTVLA